MNVKLKPINSVGAIMREAINASMRKLCAFFGTLYTAALTVLPTFCLNTNVSMDKIAGGIVDIICKIALYVGLLIAIGGVFGLVMAYKDDNADGQSRAVRFIVIGIILVGFRTVLGWTGIING